MYKSTTNRQFYHEKIGNSVNVELIYDKDGMCKVRNLETKELCDVSTSTFKKYFYKVESSNNETDDQSVNEGDDELFGSSGLWWLLFRGVCIR